MRDIKKVGTFEATVHFFKDVEVKLPIIVVAENQPEVKKEDSKKEKEVADVKSGDPKNDNDETATTETSKE